MTDLTDQQFELSILHDARVEEFVFRGDCVQLGLTLDTGKRARGLLDGVYDCVARGNVAHTIIDDLEVLRLNSTNVQAAVRSMRALDADAIRGLDRSIGDVWTREGLTWVKLIPSQGMAFQAACRSFRMKL